MLAPASAGFIAFFFFNDTATTEIYTLSLHDALPIFHRGHGDRGNRARQGRVRGRSVARQARSEEHTSELQSRLHLVCRLLLEKKKQPYGPSSTPRLINFAPICNAQSSRPI